ncbi:MAG: glycosyltransferase [Clostridia bacterium]|nr:glycosyltransferase [Clostridia bacterium]
MKKILFFGYTLEVGGAEKVLVDYINTLKDNYEIDVALLQKKGEFLEQLPKGVTVTELRKNTLSYILFRYVPFIRKLRINKIANQKDYDVAIGFFEGRSATWVADIKKPIRRLAWVHNDVNKFDIGISEREIKSTYSKMDKIITVSEVSKQSFCEKYGFNQDKVEVLYNLIDEKNIKEKAKQEIPKEQVYTFVNVGKMRKQKRQDRLVEIAKQLKDEGYKFKIQIIGNGPEEENIKELVKNNNVGDVVELLGLQTNPYPYIKNADCVVVSSDFEGYSVAIKEALLLEKPVISTDVSGVSEMFQNGKYGIATEISTSALKEKMQQVLDGKIDLKRIQENLKSFDCGNKEIVQKLINLIEG